MKEIFDKHEGIIDLIAVDTGAGETYIQPRMQSFLTEVEASKSHAIGVGGTVQRATAKGRMIVHLTLKGAPVPRPVAFVSWNFSA